MEIIVIAGILFLAFKFNIIQKLFGIYKQASAATAVEVMLQHFANKGMLNFNPRLMSKVFVHNAWNLKPDVFNGKFGQRPHNVSVATYALAVAAEDLTRKQDQDYYSVTMALGNALAELETNGGYYPLKSIDHEIIKDSMLIYASLIPNYQNPDELMS